MTKRKSPAQLDREITEALGTSLYQDLRAAGIQLDHHESDLYVLDTPTARALIARHGKKGSGFTSQIDGKRWLDVPFAYDPFWEKKSARRHHATVKTAEGLLLKCDMSKTCEEPVTHIDEKGFVYCTKHGIQRRGSGHRCRKLRPTELSQLQQGKPLARY